MQELVEAKFSIGNIVKHKFLDFRGVVFDLDPSFNNTEEWYNAIPENFRPRKDQPFYHVFAENKEILYIAYVSEQNLISDLEGGPLIIQTLKKFFHILMESATFHIMSQRIRSLYQSGRSQSQ